MACAVAAPVVALYRVPWRSALVLTPEAVTLARGRWRITTPWERVESIVAHDEPTYLRDTALHHPGIRLSTKDDDERARRRWTWAIDGQRLGVGAATAYRTLVHYWRHPEDRAGLALDSPIT